MIQFSYYKLLLIHVKKFSFFLTRMALVHGNGKNLIVAKEVFIYSKD